jgi:hypothetical protein
VEQEGKTNEAGVNATPNTAEPVETPDTIEFPDTTFSMKLVEQKM